MLEIILDQFSQGTISIQTACRMIEAYHKEKYNRPSSNQYQDIYKSITSGSKTVPRLTTQFDSTVDFYKDH